MNCLSLTFSLIAEDLCRSARRGKQLEFFVLLVYPLNEGLHQCSFSCSGISCKDECVGSTTINKVFQLIESLLLGRCQNYLFVFLFRHFFDSND